MRDFTGTNPGSYRISVQRLNNPVGCTALSYGAAPTEKTTSYAAEMDCLTFTGANLDDIRIRIIKTAGNLQPVTEVVRTDGTTKCTNDSNVDQTCTLDSGGTHRIIVRGYTPPDRRPAPTASRSNASTTPARAPARRSWPERGSRQLGNITTRPELDRFTYNATTASQKLRVRVVETGSTPTLTAMIEVVGHQRHQRLHPHRRAHRGHVRAGHRRQPPHHRPRLHRPEHRHLPDRRPTTRQPGRLHGAELRRRADREDDQLRGRDGYRSTFTGANLYDIRIRIIKTAGELEYVTEEGRGYGTAKCTPTTATSTRPARWTPVAPTASSSATPPDRINAPPHRDPTPQQPRRGHLPGDRGRSGIPTLGNITTRRKLDCFTHNATTASQKLRVRVVETGSTPTLTAMIEVVLSTGTSVRTPTGAIEVTCALDTAGNHRIIVRDFTGQSTGTYRIAVQRLDNPVGCTALSYGGAPTEKTTSYAAEMDCLTFTGATLDDIRIRIIKTAGNLQPVTEVVRTDGTTKCTNDSNVDQTCTLDSGGTHRIIVRDAAGPETGTYRIQIQRLNNPGAGTCPAIMARSGRIPALGNITTRPGAGLLHLQRHHRLAEAARARRRRRAARPR